jgi:5-methyltetrahydropteroyltriglutamate--homocysteine methyltransferase
MTASASRILTTHVGSLPRPADLIELFRSAAPAGTLEPRLAAAIGEVVRQQIDSGIDVVNDGEFGKPMANEVDYGAWANYVYGRVSGFEPRDLSADVNLLAIILGASRDWNDFAEFYATAEGDVGSAARPPKFPVNVGPIRYTGQALIQRDIANLKAALAGRKVADAFMTAVVTGVAILPGEYYRSTEQQGAAIAEAMREEYRAIIDAGFMLQLDDPLIVNHYEMFHSMNRDLAGYRKWADAHVELVNHGLAGIPEDRVRYHVCWGSWKGPHSADLPLASVLDLILKVKAGQYSVEAANPQHEHEWQDWKSVKLPAGKAVVPGVVTHKTNILEHPQVVADRLVRYAEVVGRENVIASTDCGMGGRIHPSVAWAKLRALSEGAALATRALWGRSAA